MTVQEIYEREGFLVMSVDRSDPRPIGSVAFEEKGDNGIGLPIGCPLVIVAEISKEEALEYYRRQGALQGDSPSENGYGHFYKVTAE